jgi:hypothetical protein
MIPTKSDLLRAAECKEMSDDEYDRHWESILMKPLVSTTGHRGREGRLWLTFGSCRIPYQLGGKHHTSYWIRVSPFTDDGYEDKSKEEWHLFDEPDEVVDVARGLRGAGSFAHDVRVSLWGWE